MGLLLISAETLVKMRNLGCFLSLGSLVMAEPTFPGSSGSALSTISGVIDQTTSSSAYQAQDSSSAINSALESGTRQITEGVVSDLQLEQMVAGAYIKVHERVKKMLHNGGCARDYSGCPAGWAADGGSCTPGPGYNGFCGKFPSSAGVQLKETIAWKCGVSWNCQAGGSPNFSSACPTGWNQRGSTCEAPSAYSGRCSPVTDFNGMSDDQKARWAAGCGASWQ